VTNGREILPDVDGRSLIARRYRDIAAAITSDAGGLDLCSESKLQLIRRFAAASVSRWKATWPTASASTSPNTVNWSAH
jgi:hypothetical protein